MKKVLLLSAYVGVGGAHKWVADTLTHMDRSGMRFDLYTWGSVRSGEFLPAYARMGIEVFPRALDAGRLPAALRLGADLRAFMREHGPYDAVHVNDPPLLMHAICVHTAESMGVPVRIVHMHNPNRKKLGLLGRAVRAWTRGYVLRHASCVAACSQLVIASKLGPRVIGEHKLHILKNGIETEKFRFSPEDRATVRGQLGLGESEYVILHVGRFAPEKNQLFLLDVMDAVRARDKTARLVLLGDGPDRAAIEARIKALGLEDAVLLPGWQSRTAPWYSAADAFVLPSLYEGFPISAMEAQAGGLPCLLSDAIPPETNVAGRARYLPLERDAWAEALGARRERDADAWEKVRAAGYDLDQTAQQFRKLLMGEGSF